MDDRRDDPAVDAWSFVWSAAILFATTAFPGSYHFFLNAPTSAGPLSYLVLAGTAACLLVRPSGRRGLAVLAAAQLLQVGIALPFVANHQFVLALTNLCFLAAMLPSPGLRVTDTFAAFQRAARGVTIACYAFASFAKLNGDFVDPRYGCAGQFYADLAGYLVLPDEPWIRRAVAWGTLGIEGLLPIGLMSMKGRWQIAPIAIGILFHFLLSFDYKQHFVNFSAVMCATLLLFLPAKDLTAFVPDRRIRAMLATGFGALIVLGLLTARQAVSINWFYAWRQLLWLLFICAVIRVLLQRSGETEGTPRLTAPWPSFIVALAVVNGLSPYLGLKTRTAFNMYSNLRIDAESSNHFVVPRSLDVLGLLGDRVRVLAVDKRMLGLTLRRGSEWPWFEFSRLVGASDDVRITFVRGGERITHDAKRGGRLAQPPWYLRKFLFFRRLDEAGRDECVW